MTYSEPILIKVDGFTVAGLSVRTINSDEFNPNTAKLGKMWEQFLSDGMADKIPSRIANSPIYGVYSHYDSDASDYYTVTAGVSVNPEVTVLELDRVDVHGGQYLVFAAQGPIPDVLIKTWGRIWSYFEGKTEYQRNFTTDFEVYLGPEDIAVYIGVR